MSNIEHYTTTARWGSRSGNQLLYDRLDRGREMSQPPWRFGPISGMIETAENLAADYTISRDAADAFAARSHQRAAAAQPDVGAGESIARQVGGIADHCVRHAATPLKAAAIP